MNSSTERADGSKTCGFSDHLDILRELPFFTGLPLEVIKLLAYLSQTETHRAGDVLCEQDETMDRSFFLLCGEIEVLRRERGQEHSLGRRGQGFFFGGLALLAPVKSLYLVRAVADTECLTLTKERFIKTVERFPEVVPKVLSTVVEHIFSWEESFLVSHAGECALQGEKLGLTLF